MFLRLLDGSSQSRARVARLLVFVYNATGDKYRRVAHASCSHKDAKYVNMPSYRLRSLLALLCLLLAVGILAACEYIDSALPPTPSPFPTLARLPSVTPITPSPAPPPTATVPAVTAPELPGLVVVDANVRAGPGLDFEIVNVMLAGTTVLLRGRTDTGWFQVLLPDGTEGWMFEQVLEVPPETFAQLPIVQ